MIRFKAKYVGTCARCEEKIYVDDDVAMFADNIHHYRCAMLSEQDARKELTHEQKTRPGCL